jgi:peptidyl-prolyl cis-trans isomerase C
MIKIITTAVLLGALGPAITQTSFAAGDTPAGPKVDKTAELFGDPVIARGRDFEIKRSQLEEAFVKAKATAAAAGVTFSESERKLLEIRLVNEMVVGNILSGKATDTDKQRAREAAEKFVADARKQLGTEEAFNAKLKLNKLTLEELRAKLAKEALPSAVLEREMQGMITITDAQVKKFYDEKPERFEQPETVRAAHILIGTRNPLNGAELSADQKAAKRKQIDDLLQRAKGGEDFGKLARQYSEDTGSKDNGGEVTFSRGTRGVPLTFEATAFNLKTNEVSQVVTTDFGYHLIKLLEKMPARVVPLPEVSKNIKDYLTQQEGAKLAPAFFAKLKKEAGVEILDESLKMDDKETEVQPPAAGDKTGKPGGKKS